VRWGRRHKVAALLVVGPLVTLFMVLVGMYLTTGKPLSALPGLNQGKMPHYVFSIYGVAHPMGVAVTPSGERIYVTESDGAHVVRIFNRSGKQIGTLQPPKSVPGAHVPVYVAIDPLTQDVYVSDRPSRAIYIYDAQGAYRRSFAPRGNLGGGWAPLGIAFGPDGTLYATDVSGPNHRILAFGRDGTLLRAVGAPGQFLFPNGVAVGPQGAVLATDSNHGRLVALNGAGDTVWSIGRGGSAGDLGLPRGIAIADGPRLYVVEATAHEVKVYSLDGSGARPPRYIGSFGVEGLANGAFEFPNGVATDARARIYVTDRENNRLQVWSY
jgi:DNA-binding beta-propeller fold protein YncE